MLCALQMFRNFHSLMNDMVVSKQVVTTGTAFVVLDIRQDLTFIIDCVQGHLHLGIVLKNVFFTAVMLPSYTRMSKIAYIL